MAEVQPLGEGWYLVIDGEKRWRVAIAHAPDATWVFVDGHVARIDAAAPAASRGRAKGRGESGVMAPMPATVVAINTAAGQPVTAGETVIVLEAMKMELPIRATEDGTVATVNCRVGELVQPGAALVEID